ncbi:MAG: hypothetical protein SAK29_01170 [Scytonema sp. PMC 1069.18]|nr:hypothetical protein [Scytonema sp. PMC 1069.18]MEC4882273.1 hypothetical protein [Scytonema sp. PMC 1070.18]
MPSRVQQLFPTVLLFSALFSTLAPLTPANSQTLKTAQHQLQTNNRQSKNAKSTPEKMSQANLLAEEVKPTVVRIGVGYKATAYLTKNGKIYNIRKMVSGGTGFFVKIP